MSPQKASISRTILASEAVVGHRPQDAKKLQLSTFL
jgi:hypothetical protein